MRAPHLLPKAALTPALTRRAVRAYVNAARRPGSQLTADGSLGVEAAEVLRHGNRHAGRQRGFGACRIGAGESDAYGQRPVLGACSAEGPGQVSVFGEAVRLPGHEFQPGKRRDDQFAAELFRPSGIDGGSEGVGIKFPAGGGVRHAGPFRQRTWCRRRHNRPGPAWKPLRACSGRKAWP